MSKVFNLFSFLKSIQWHFLYINRKTSRMIYIRPLTQRMRSYLGLEVLLFLYPSAILSLLKLKNKTKSYVEEQQWETTAPWLERPKPEHWHHQTLPGMWSDRDSHSSRWNEKHCGHFGRHVAVSDRTKRSHHTIALLGIFPKEVKKLHPHKTLDK